MRRLAMLGVVLVLLTTGATADSRRVVTVEELFELNHQLTIEAGTEVVWGDPHFERVWFPSNVGPKVKRTKDGFVTVFQTPGTYRGRFTVVAGHGTTDVYSITVIVKGVDR
jgi:hypothetical protein